MGNFDKVVLGEKNGMLMVSISCSSRFSGKPRNKISSEQAVLGCQLPPYGKALCQTPCLDGLDAGGTAQLELAMV
jgi:hypothetical protein